MSDIYRVGIVGYGVVGRGIHKLFKDSVVTIYDPAYDDISLTDAIIQAVDQAVYPRQNDKESFKDLDLSVVCVPTDQNADWGANTSAVWETLEWLSEINPDGVILLKSTVPPSELIKMAEIYKHVVFSPEYMGESKYFTPAWKYPHPQNMESHTWQTFGGERENTSKCIDIFKRRMGVDTQYWQTDIVTASLAKYIENSFFAMKVTFVNEWYDITKAYGVDWNELRELWLLDPRINRNHTLVFTKDRGYSGKCFPKDTRAIVHDVKKVGYEPKLMMAMDEVNQVMRGKNDPT
jgi:UDPglucose 6-dehydrogenase